LGTKNSEIKKKENNMFDCYKLSDSAIAQIAKVLQVAILTGTDITDNLRLIKFVSNEGVLDLESEYEKTFNNNLEAMISEVQELVEETNESE